MILTSVFFAYSNVMMKGKISEAAGAYQLLHRTLIIYKVCTSNLCRRYFS